MFRFAKFLLFGDSQRSHLQMRPISSSQTSTIQHCSWVKDAPNANYLSGFLLFLSTLRIRAKILSEKFVLPADKRAEFFLGL